MDKYDTLLLRAGMPAKRKGYRYAKAALKLLEEDGSCIESLSGRLYPVLADRFGTTVGAVEKAIRNGIEAAFDRMMPGMPEELFGNSISPVRGKPTNGEFLAVMALHLERTVQEDG